METFRREGGEIGEIGEDFEVNKEAHLIVDAIFGTGYVSE
jgi:NAD(P)H-hydrate repair Nnr-like enzyme with NAD(P)H-hydrate epimerase domain